MTQPAKATMKARARNGKGMAGSRARTHLAFTLPEYLITMALAVIVSGVILASYIFGARMHALASLKITATDQSRTVVTQFTHDIRTAATFKIGDGDPSRFKPTEPTAYRQGTAIQIYPTADTNVYVHYYLDSADSCLKLMRNDSSQPSLLASAITNTVIFTAEDPWGNVTTNERPAEIVGLVLQFSQSLYSGNSAVASTKVTSATSYRDSYQIKTKVNKRITLGYQN